MRRARWGGGARRRGLQDKKALAGFVGFANLPNQVHRRSVKKGFQFTVLVVGEAGLGKATLVNTLFGTKVIPARPTGANPEAGATAVTVKTHASGACRRRAAAPVCACADRLARERAREGDSRKKTDIEEKGVRLRVNILESVGFGDFINNDASWKPLVQAIDERFDAYLDQERKVNRQGMADNRIHCCLYFVPPTGHAYGRCRRGCAVDACVRPSGADVAPSLVLAWRARRRRLRALDIEFMKQVHTKVNLIPVIAKSDTLTREELAQFKKRILDDLAFHKIQTFAVAADATDDAETANIAKDLMVRSARRMPAQGRRRVGRRSPLGTTGHRAMVLLPGGPRHACPLRSSEASKSTTSVARKSAGASTRGASSKVLTQPWGAHHVMPWAGR